MPLVQFEQGHPPQPITRAHPSLHRHILIDTDLYLYILFFINTLLFFIPVGKFGLSYLGKPTAAARVALPMAQSETYKCMLGLFVFP